MQSAEVFQVRWPSPAVTLIALGVAGALVLAACGDDDGGGDIAAFCDAVERIETIEPFDFADDPDAFQTAIADLRAALDDARGNAPSEIRDDVEQVASQTDQAFQALSEIEDPSDEAEVEAAFAVLENADGEVDSDEVDAFILSECGIDTADGAG